MKWMLIAAVLNMQPVYTDQETCEKAADQIRKVYYPEAAMCLPMPQEVINPQEQEVDAMFEKFFELVKKIQTLQSKQVDNAQD